MFLFLLLLFSNCIFNWLKSQFTQLKSTCQMKHRAGNHWLQLAELQRRTHPLLPASPHSPILSSVCMCNRIRLSSHLWLSRAYISTNNFMVQFAFVQGSGWLIFTQRMFFWLEITHFQCDRLTYKTDFTSQQFTEVVDKMDRSIMFSEVNPKSLCIPLF